MKEVEGSVEGSDTTMSAKNHCLDCALFHKFIATLMDEDAHLKTQLQDLRWFFFC